MRGNEKRFSFHGRIVVKDKLLGSSMQVDIGDISRDTKTELFKEIEEKLKENAAYVATDKEPSKKEIAARIDGMREDGWDNRRIANFFTKFGIEVDLPRKKRLKNGQQSLEGVGK